MVGRRLTIYIDDADRWQHRALHTEILARLHKAGCAGATVTRGVAGFGARGFIKTADIEVAANLPLVITVIDTPERIDGVVPEIAAMLSGGIVTVDDTEIRYFAAPFRGGLPDAKVSDVMTRDPETASPETPLADVVERLLARDYTALPVVDAERRLVGMIDEAQLLDRGLTELSLGLHKVIGGDLVREYLSQLKESGLRVRQAMTTASSVSETAALRDAAHVMHAKGLKRLPVVDDAGRLVGMLGRLDILRTIASGRAPRTSGPIALPRAHQTVGQIMERGVPTVGETTPLLDVLDKLLESDLKRVIVVDAADRPLGIITDTDLASRADPDDRPGLLTAMRSRWNKDARDKVRRARAQRAAELMSTPLVTVLETASVMDALALTAQRHVKRIPVVAPDGKVVGMVSRPMLLAACLDAV